MLIFGFQYKAFPTLEPYTSSNRNRAAKAFYHKEKTQQEVSLLRMMFFLEILSQGEPEKLSFGTRNAPTLTFPTYGIFTHFSPSPPTVWC